MERYENSSQPLGGQLVIPAQRGHLPSLPRMVVGVDGSAASIAALRWAAAEARRRGARLSVVVAYRHDMTLRPPLGTDAPHAATDVLSNALAAAAVPADSVETQIVDDTPAVALVRAARGADLLVLGHQAHSPLSRTLLGAVNTDRDVEFRCPVVVVPPECT